MNQNNKLLLKQKGSYSLGPYHRDKGSILIRFLKIYLTFGDCKYNCTYELICFITIHKNSKLLLKQKGSYSLGPYHRDRGSILITF